MVESLSWRHRSIIVFTARASKYLADYCVPVSEVPGCQHLRSVHDVVNCLFQVFIAARLEAVIFSRPY